jgi:protein ImuB
MRFGLTVRVGVADTFGAAHALAWWGEGCESARSGETLPALAARPVAALRLDQETVRLLGRLGFKTIGSLVGVPRVALERRFRSRDEARRVLLRLDQALGVVEEVRRPLLEPPVLSVRQPFSAPLMSSEALLHHVEEVISAFCRRLDRAGVGVRAARLLLYRTDCSVAEVVLRTSAATRTPSHLLKLVAEKLGVLDLGFGVDLLVVEAVRVEAIGARQETLLEGARVAMDQTRAALIDQLAARLGAECVFQVQPNASHWPERAEHPVSAMMHTPAVGANFWLQPGCARRPCVILSKPEPMAVMAEIPEGAPVRFTWRRVMHKVARAQGPERIETEWWRRLGSSSGERSRDYYALEDEDGAQFWVFREGRYASSNEPPKPSPTDTEEEREAMPTWFVHGLFA